jgi:hypothetical protein
MAASFVLAISIRGLKGKERREGTLFGDVQEQPVSSGIR